MIYEPVTKSDLESFRQMIVSELRQIIRETISDNTPNETRGVKTKAAIKLLNCSVNTLNALVVKGCLRQKKIGGANYYNWQDLQKLLNDGF